MRLSVRFVRGLVFLAFLLALAGGSSLHATTAKKKKPPADERTLVTSVDMAHQKITFEYMKDHSHQTYVVDAGTAVTVNGSPGKLGDVREGMQVKGSINRDAETLDSLDIETATPAPK